MLLLFISLFFILDCSVIALIYMQNQKAEKFYDLAIQETEQGQYTQASSNLNTASKCISLPSTHVKIKLLQNKDNNWVEDQINLDQAKNLANEHKYSEATLKLNAIGKDFPTYKQVVNEEEVIKSETALVNKPNVNTSPIIITSTPSTKQIVTIEPAHNTIPVYTGYGYNFY